MANNITDHVSDGGDLVHTSQDEEPPINPNIAATLTRAVKKAGVDVEAFDTKGLSPLKALRALQAKIHALAKAPSTEAELEQFDSELQVVAIEAANRVDEAGRFLAMAEKKGYTDDPLFKEQVEVSRDIVALVETSPNLRRFVGNARAFMDLDKIEKFGRFVEVLDILVDQSLAFKAKHDPTRPPRVDAVVIGTMVYLPHTGSVISERCWSHVVATRQRFETAKEERRGQIKKELEAFRGRATPGLNPRDALLNKAEGLIFVSTAFPESVPEKDNHGEPILRDGRPTFRLTGRMRSARMLVEVGRGNFTVAEVFEPDSIQFILLQSTDTRQDPPRPRRFPLDPVRFNDMTSVPWGIRSVVWPAIENWLKALAIQAKGTITPEQVLAGDEGLCAIFVNGAKTAGKQKDDLTLLIKCPGDGTFLLEGYFSRRGLFDFEALLKLEQSMPLQEAEDENPFDLPSEWRIVAIQARQVRQFFALVAGWERDKAIRTKVAGLPGPSISVKEGLAGATGHTVFHSPRAKSETRGPAHTTCLIIWDEKGLTLQEWASWTDPNPYQRGRALDLTEVVDIHLPRQPGKKEKASTQVLRHLLEERSKYDERESEVTAEEENGDSSVGNNHS